MNAVLGGQTNKKILKQLSTTFIDYPRPSSGTRVIHHRSISSITAVRTTPPAADILSALDEQIRAVNAALELVGKRQSILGKAMERCDTLRVDVSAEEVGKKKGGKAVDDRACGWVRRLIWSDEDVQTWVHVDGAAAEEDMLEGETCMLLRKRCDRHGG
jgi:COMPASS component SPP1